MSSIQFWQKYIGAFFQADLKAESKNVDLALLTPTPEPIDLLPVIDYRLSPRQLRRQPFDFAIALGRYNDNLHKKLTDLGQLIYLMKYHYIREAAESATEFACQQLQTIKLPHHPDLVVTVPDSLVNRPFSPTRLISYGLADHFDSERAPDLIQRRRLSLSQKDRPWNVKLSDNRMRYHLSNKDFVRDKHILLFDDIFDTGQTAIEAGSHLRSAGAKSVMLVTLVYLGKSPAA